MKTIALTGNPYAQLLANEALTALLAGGVIQYRVRVGLSTRAEAHAVHDEGGEIWHCGAGPVHRDLVGLVDRVVGAADREGVGLSVRRSLTELLHKINLTGEPQ